MAKHYICKGCNKGCERGVTHKCDQTCSDCMSIPPCAVLHVRNPCESCNRHFRNQTYFDRHKTNKLKGKTVCEQKRNCVSCGRLFTREEHECFKPYCANCKWNVEIGHLCYMSLLKNKLPRSDDVLLVFYDLENMQDTNVSDSATLHVPNLVCLQQFCTQCEMLPDIDEDCQRCGKRRHSFWDDPVGD